jgi:hypothetical protein
MTNPPPTPTAPADAGTPPPVTVHRFIVGGGSVVIDGKSHWPNMLRLEMTREDAFDLMWSLISQLRTGRKHIEVSWMGQTTEEHDD